MKMKKIKLAIIALGLSSTVMAQSVELSGTAGYMVSGSINSYYGDFDIANAAVFGGALSVEVGDLTHIEFSYRRNNTNVRSYYYNNDYNSNTVNLGIDHFQLGVLREFMDGKVKPFSQISLGASRYFERSDIKSNESWTFTGAFGLGAKFFLTDFIGLRIQTNLIMPMQFSGIGIGCGFGTGGASCGGGASFYVPVLHWEIGGGLVIRIAN